MPPKKSIPTNSKTAKSVNKPMSTRSTAANPNKEKMTFKEYLDAQQANVSNPLSGRKIDTRPLRTRNELKQHAKEPQEWNLIEDASTGEMSNRQKRAVESDSDSDDGAKPQNKKLKIAPRIIQNQRLDKDARYHLTSEPNTDTITHTLGGDSGLIKTTAEIHAQPDTPRRSFDHFSRLGQVGHQPQNILGSSAVSTSKKAKTSKDDDPINRLANTLESLVNHRDASIGDSDSRLGNRLRFARKLPEFSGDPLEWLHFKEIYKTSSELGEYNDRENIARLFAALKGEARETVKTLLATTCDAEAVLETLELHYGSRNVIAKKILNDIYGLPELESNAINITQFATKLRNAVSAFKSLELTGYIHSPDILKSVASKLPSALKYTYNRYAPTVTSTDIALEKLADFLCEEAELAITAGVLDLDTVPVSSKPTASPHKGSARPSRSAVVCTNVENLDNAEPLSEPSNNTNKNCVCCDRPGHKVTECKEFAKQRVNRRWFVINKNRLCYQCLGSGHRRNECKGALCHICGKNHHGLLHHFKEKRISLPDKTKETPANVNKDD